MLEAAHTSDLVLTLKIGDETVAIPADEIVEVVLPGAITRVPNAPPGMIGVSNLRSAVLPIVSLRHLLGQQNVASAASTRIVVVGRDYRVGLLVDDVGALGRSGPARRLDIIGLLKPLFATLGRRANKAHAAATPANAEIRPSERNETALLCFLLGNQEYALPLGDVHEVSALELKIAELPDAAAAVLGVATLADRIVPIVSMSTLLGLPTPKIDERTSRVIVVQLGIKLVGLVCDSLKEILRVPKNALDAVPMVLTRAKGEARVEAICRLTNGRLVSVLSARRLFNDAMTERLLADTPDGATEMRTAARKEQFIVFQLGDEMYGLPLAAVDEVVRLPEIVVRVPRAPDFIEGVMNLRGKTVPLIDQRRRFSIGGPSVRSNRRVVIVTITGVQVGFVVDRVSEVLAIDRQELQPAPEFGADSASVFDRVANIEGDGRMILLVDPKALLDLAERDLVKGISSATDAAET